jgi:RNA polymerase sigma-70 factor (ECF subfamily)
VEEVYRAESRRIFATLIRLLRNFDLAEEALHDAFRAALERWPNDGEPANPKAWLISVGRFKAIDRIRRDARFGPLDETSRPVIVPDDHTPEEAAGSIEDDLLRLIFICCHPALSPDFFISCRIRSIPYD